MIKSQHKNRFVKFCLPISIALAVVVGVFSFPSVAGDYSPYTSLGIVYFFDDWSTVNTMGYVAMFALIQFFLFAYVCGILSLIFTRYHYYARKQHWAAIALIISMSFFLLAVILFAIWIGSGWFIAFLSNTIVNQAAIDTLDNFFLISIVWVLPALILLFALIALVIWLVHFFQIKKEPVVKQHFNFAIFRNSQIPWSGKDKQLKIICVVGLGILLLQIIFTCVSVHKNSDTEIFTNIWAKIWFGTLHHFTELSNLWVAIFFIIFLLNYKWHFLKTSTFVTMTITYISVTFLIADFLLAPFMILNHSSGSINMGFGGTTSWYDWVKTVLFHVVQPIVVFVFFGFFCKAKRQYQPWKFSKVVPITMIFPILYLIYALTINYLPIEHLQKQTEDGQPVIVYGGISVYGYFTCINPDVKANVFSEETHNPIWQGNMKNIVWYIFSVCLFTALTFYYNWIERHTMAVKYLKAKKLYHSNYHLHWN